VWSTRDGAGMGVPEPLYYHKTFYYISSFFYIISANMKVSILFSIGSLMIAGIVGIYKTAVFLDNSKLVSILASLSFVCLNYTMSDWFLRGAMAEFSAMMILPFLILEELKLLKSGKYSISTSVILILLFLSHSMIGYYSLFTVLITLIFSSFMVSRQEALMIFKRIAVSALVILCVLLIYIVPMYVISGYFDPSGIKENNLVPKYKFVEFVRYLYDYKYEWFSKPYWMFSVQFDLPVVILIIVSLVLFVLRKNQIRVTTFKVRAIFFLLSLDLFFVFLQLKPSNFFYENVPGADFIQFPWRLLTFITILHLNLLLWFLGHLKSIKPSKTPHLLSGILLLSVVIIYPPFKGTKYWWYKKDEVERKINVTCNVGEYLPSIFGDDFLYLQQHMYLLSRRGIEIKEKGNYMEILNKEELKNEALRVRLKADIENISEVVLPVTYSALTRMYKLDQESKKKQQIPVYRTDSDPRIRAVLPYGDYLLQIDLPTLKNLFIRAKKPFNRDVFELVECDIEHLSEYETYLVSNCGLHLLKGAQNRTSEKSRSGSYSLKLENDGQFGLDYMVNTKKDYKNYYEASVWCFGGGNGSLVVDGGEHLFICGSFSGEIDQEGWRQMKVRFKLPQQINENDKVKIYVQGSSDGKPVYFDDFRLEKAGSNKNNN